MEQNESILRLIVHACEDRKAENIVAYDMKTVSSIADYFVICNGTNERQVQAIAGSVKEVAEKAGYSIERMEGFENARWILIDIGDIVCHVFHEEERLYYQLDKLWGDATSIDVSSLDQS